MNKLYLMNYELGGIYFGTRKNLIQLSFAVLLPQHLLNTP